MQLSHQTNSLLQVTGTPLGILACKLQLHSCLIQAHFVMLVNFTVALKAYL